MTTHRGSNSGTHLYVHFGVTCFNVEASCAATQDLVACLDVQAETLRGHANRWRPLSMWRVNIGLYVGPLDSSSSLNLKKCKRAAATIFICLYANSFPKQIRGPA